MLDKQAVSSIDADVQSRGTRLSRYNGTLSKCVPNLSSFVMFEQNTVSFNVSTATTSSASIAHCAVSPSSLTLKMIGTLDRKTSYEDVNFPLLTLLPQSTPGNAVSLKITCIHVMANSVVSVG